jgi:hypothetical protein
MERQQMLLFRLLLNNSIRPTISGFTFEIILIGIKMKLIIQFMPCLSAKTNLYGFLLKKYQNKLLN